MTIRTGRLTYDPIYGERVDPNPHDEFLSARIEAVYRACMTECQRRKRGHVECRDQCEAALAEVKRAALSSPTPSSGIGGVDGR